jgi:hypothetical protein
VVRLEELFRLRRKGEVRGGSSRDSVEVKAKSVGSRTPQLFTINRYLRACVFAGLATAKAKPSTPGVS